jgi:8-oxo-dGTP pyrophosphatase MutT (NUDIX family)
MPLLKEGAGVMLLTEQEKVLLLRRTSASDHAGEWCFPGGALDYGEMPVQTAVREAFEETGITLGYEDIEPFHECNTKGLRFTTFLRQVDEEFIPELNDEHDAYCWAPISKPVEPLHPGVEETLRHFIGSDPLSDPRFVYHEGDLEILHMPGEVDIADATPTRATLHLHDE